MSAAPSTLGTIRALICEDEPIAVRALKEYLKDVPWVKVVGEAREGKEAMRLIHKLEPDLVFMDVQMPRLTGVEVLEAVTHHPAVVFTTAYDEYAVKAFELGAVDYLVKPFGRERFLECLGRVRVKLLGEGMLGTPPGEAEPDKEAPGPRPGLRGGPVDRLFARRGNAIVPVLTGDILRVAAVEGRAEAVTAEGAFELEMTLAEVEDRLDSRDFLRVHRAHIVNLRHVQEIKPYDERRLALRLKDGTTLVASRRGSQGLKERMG